MSRDRYYGDNLPVEELFQVFEILASILFEESGTSRGSPTFTLEADLTAFRWDKDIRSSPFAEQFLESTMEILTLRTLGRSDAPEDESTPDPRLTGVLACMLFLAPSATSFKFKSAIKACLSRKKYTIALLEALGRVSGDVVVNACTNLGLYLDGPLFYDNLISGLGTITRPDASIQESTQVTSTSKHKHHSLTVSHALKITCLATHIWGETEELFESTIRFIYDSVGITSLLGQADDSLPEVQLTLAIQRSSQLRELETLAILAKCCLEGVGYDKDELDLPSFRIVNLPYYKQLGRILATIYIASSPLDKDFREDQELSGLAGLVEEVRNAMTIVEELEQSSSATAGPHAGEDEELNWLDALLSMHTTP